MKTTVLLLAMGVIIFASSCKKDDDSTENTPVATATKCLITKIMEKDSSYTDVSYNSINFVSTVNNYDKNSLFSDGLDLFYTNSKLTSINSLDSNNNTEAIFNYIYNGDKLDKMFYLEDADADDQINDTIMTYQYFISTKADSIHIYYGALLYNKFYFTWAGNNIVKSEKYTYSYSNSTFELSTTIDYEFDTKDNFNHGIGIDYLIFDDGDFSPLCINNYSKITVKDENGTVDNNSSKDYFNEYNSVDDVIKSTSLNFNGDTLKVETYTYTCN
jgi:hypothetical protein